MNWLINFLLHRGNDLSTYFIPNAYFFKRSFLDQHQVPFWNPLQLGGLPYLADPQNYLFYLPNYLFLLLPIEIAFLILISAHLIWGAFGMYKLSHSKFAALIFVFSPMLMSHLEAGHYTMLIAFSWLPWFMLTAFKFVKKPSAKLSCYLSLVAFFLYINYINIAFYALGFYAIYAILQPKKSLIHNSLFIILFLGLISPNLLAQIKFAPESTRSLITFADVAQPVWSLKLFLQNLFFPFLLNPDQLATERVLYPGIFIWILAAVGWWKTKDKFLLSWLIFNLLFALGSRTPFFGFLYTYFPLIKFMRIPSRIWIISILFLAVYAGKGLRRASYAVYALMLLSFVDIFLINYKIFSRPIIKTDVPNSFYEIITKDNSHFSVYCTTGCWSLQKLGELGIPTIAGNNPIQRREIVEKLAEAAGYTYHQYIPVLPPYEVFSKRPQPKAELMKNLQVKYIASPYVLTDPGLQLTHRENSYYLYALNYP